MLSQVNNIDSLMQMASAAKNDPTKVNILNTLSENLMQIGEISRTISISNEALNLSQNINGIASSYNNLGLIERMKGNYLESLEFQKKALKLYEKLMKRKVLHRVTFILAD
jgi:tetratricopeptide (TPR) repeat protein